MDNIEVTINEYLGDLRNQLSIFLENTLPSLSENWWKEFVITSLSDNQLLFINQKKIDTLSGLDLAGVIKVLDSNWIKISNFHNLPNEFRNYIKELQSIRNKYAHKGSNLDELNDIYRELDTFVRVLKYIKADNKIIEKINQTKKKNIPKDDSDEKEKIREISKSTEEVLTMKGSIFKMGEYVTLISDPSKKFPITKILPIEDEIFYNVFSDNSEIRYHESQLQKIQNDVENLLHLNSEEFHSFLSAVQINNPSLTNLYSLNSARIDFYPYQFKPVLKFIKSDRPRLLIADSVGIGKTIEAGLILKELQARMDINSVLIVCPRPLVTEKKWQVEMKKFDEKFNHLDGEKLKYILDEMDKGEEWLDEYKKCIIPYSLFDESLLKKIKKLDTPPKFDLIIIDEAHHIRNQETYKYKIINQLCEHAVSVVFLTATPIQMSNDDLFVLLSTLCPDLIVDKESFEHMSAPNKFINAAISSMRGKDKNWQLDALKYLIDAGNTAWGRSMLLPSPLYESVCERLNHKNIEDEERIKLISITESLHSFSNLINRTRRRDIGNFTVRKPDTVEIEFTREQMELHDEILEIQADIFKTIQPSANLKFYMSTIRRQAASSLYALVPFLNEILNRHVHELAWAEAEANELPNEELFKKYEKQINLILEKSINLKKEDPKLLMLIKILNDKKKLENNKVIIFSSFKHTLNYLYENLLNLNLRVSLIHGGIPDEDRNIIRKKFEKAKDEYDSIDVLLLSEVGCEGLDYQFCDCLINYDLPWNPMKIEQRIGRIDRRGQKSESIAIINLITPNTIDAEIYHRCLLRIGVFNSEIGENEEILGEISSEIKNIAENFSLTKEEINKKLQQLAENKIRSIQEKRKVEEEQLHLFSIQLSNHEIENEELNKEINRANNNWLTPNSIQRLVNFYLKVKSKREQNFISEDKNIKILRMSQELRNSLLDDFNLKFKPNNNINREWEKWLKGTEQYLHVTFDSANAIGHPKSIFINPIHPLVKQSASYFETKKNIFSKLQISSNDLPKGKYEFAIYQWKFYGIKPDLQLKAITIDEKINNKILELLKDAKDYLGNDNSNLGEDIKNKLDIVNFNKWKTEREIFSNETKNLANFKKESLKVSHISRTTIIKDQLEKAKDEKIKRMKIGELNKAEVQYNRKIHKLDLDSQSAEIEMKLLVLGILYII